MTKLGVEGFLLGIIASCSFFAGLLFLKFWSRTRDSLFLAFSAAFLIEGVNRIAVLFVAAPNRGSWIIYFVRFCAALIILIAIVRKNSGARRTSR